MKITYALDDSGWATATFTDNDKEVSVSASYLHDTLKQLVEAAINLNEGAQTSCVVFMNEPGEFQLVLDKQNETYSLRAYDDWASWDMFPIENYNEVLNGTVNISIFCKQVLDLTDKIYVEYGIDGYKGNWIEHDFPYNQYMKLKRAINT